MRIGRVRGPADLVRVVARPVQPPDTRVRIAICAVQIAEACVHFTV